MAFVMGVIGLLSGVMGIWSFVEDQIPSTPKPDPEDLNKYINMLRMQVGLNGAEQDGRYLWGAGGRIDSIIHYDGNGDVIGYGPTNKLEPIVEGAWHDWEVATSSGAQAVTTQIRTTEDDICIATMAMTWSDGKKFGWTGDWGTICGLPSYYSGIFMDNGESPWCTWLVAFNRYDRTPAWAIDVTWPDFAANSPDAQPPTDEEAQEFCGSSFKAYDYDTYEQILAPGKSHLNKRGLSHFGRSDDRLIVSSRNQNATSLCERPNSHGPDFVSLQEGVYCNMETRETFPLCTENLVSGTECFDVESTSHVSYDGGHKPSIRARNPTNVIHW